MEVALNINDKYEKLKEIIKGYKKAVIAYSGGVDSTFLVKVAYDVLKDNSTAVTIVSPMLSESEKTDALEMAEKIGIAHILIEDDEIEEQVQKNGIDRCYHCKKIEFGNIIEAAKDYNIQIVCDGSNVDDLSDYRPGLNAISEMQVKSPLRDAGLTKAEIRELSKALGLRTWDKPAFACLASRIPYGEKIDNNKLRRIDKSEIFLRNLGFKQLRVRSHGDTARIEISREEREKMFNVDIMDKVSEELKKYGFTYVSMELGGYKMGNMNAKINDGIKK